MVVAGIVVVAVVSTSCSSDSNASPRRAVKNPHRRPRPNWPPESINRAPSRGRPGGHRWGDAGGFCPARHGHQLRRGGDGLHPGEGFSGTDKCGDHRRRRQAPPTMSRRSRLSAEWSSRAAPTVRPSPRSWQHRRDLRPQRPGPNVDGRTDNEKVLPVPTSNHESTIPAHDGRSREDDRADGSDGRP
jgi:hypothetical protein